MRLGALTATTKGREGGRGTGHGFGFVLLCITVLKGALAVSRFTSRLLLSASFFHRHGAARTAWPALPGHRGAVHACPLAVRHTLHWSVAFHTLPSAPKDSEPRAQRSSHRSLSTPPSPPGSSSSSSSSSSLPPSSSWSALLLVLLCLVLCMAALLLLVLPTVCSSYYWELGVSSDASVADLNRAYHARC